VHASDGFHNPIERISENKINGNFFIAYFEFKDEITVVVNNEKKY
jgi:hypothetical protein